MFTIEIQWKDFLDSSFFSFESLVKPHNFLSHAVSMLNRPNLTDASKKKENQQEASEKNSFLSCHISYLLSHYACNLSGLSCGHLQSKVAHFHFLGDL